MSEGLKRAAAATAATRAKALTGQDTEEIRFLAALIEGRELPPADRPQDKARQRCKRSGWAVYAGSWAITLAGRAALAAAGH